MLSVRFFKLCFQALVCSSIFVAGSFALASDVANPPSSSMQTLEITKTTTMNQINALPDTAQIKTPSGRVVTAKQYKKLADIIQMIQKRGTAIKPKPQFILSHSTSAPKVKLVPGSDIKSIASRPDSDVVQLPDGRTFTVGDLKKISKVHEKIRGKSLLTLQGTKLPVLTGPAIKVYSLDDFKKLEDKPDSTILETVSGKRMTLGALRAYAKASGNPVGVRK